MRLLLLNSEGQWGNPGLPVAFSAQYSWQVQTESCCTMCCITFQQKLYPTLAMLSYLHKHFVPKKPFYTQQSCRERGKYVTPGPEELRFCGRPWSAEGKLRKWWWKRPFKQQTTSNFLICFDRRPYLSENSCVETAASPITRQTAQIITNAVTFWPRDPCGVKSCDLLLIFWNACAKATIMGNVLDTDSDANWGQRASQIGLRAAIG